MMNWKPVYRYQLMDQKNALLIYYLVLVSLCVVLFASTMSMAQADTAAGEFSGVEMASMIFLFVVGLNSFKDSFYMMLQHGISRKTMFFSHVLSMLSIAAGMALVDQVLALLLRAAAGLNGSIVYHSLYEQIYPGTGVATFGKSLLYNAVAYLTFLGAGSVVTVLFYRLNKAGKVAVGAGVPVMLFVALPLADTALCRGALSQALLRFADYALGVSRGAPIHALITGLIIFTFCLACRWLLTRRAVVRG